MRKSEHNVKVGQPKQFLFASGKPSLAGLRRASGDYGTSVYDSV
jgi:hypothetical protein